MLRNDANGQFSVDASLPSAGNHPASVVTGDFNDDTRLDFAIADFGTHPLGGDLGDVRVFLADTVGGYQSRVGCAVGFGPSGVTAADLNEDHILDLVVTNFLSDTVTVCTVWWGRWDIFSRDDTGRRFRSDGRPREGCRR